MKLATNNILATDATQVRTKLHKEVIDAYREELEAGATFPPLTVFAEKNSERFILADGFHRLYAAIHAGHEVVEVELHEGGMVEALKYALGANTSHGLRRSNADKINAVKLAYKNPEISEMSSREIAAICRVHHSTVARVRQDLLDKEEQKRSVAKRQMPEENSPANNRLSRPAPTQEMVDREELRKAMSLIKSFPYDGDHVQRLGLSKDDITDLNYCLDWLTKALEAYVATQYETNSLDDSATITVNKQ